MQTMITAALQTAGRELTKFHDEAKEATSTGGGFKQMESVLVGIAKNLTGPVKLAMSAHGGKADLVTAHAQVGK
jgi:hypothetical protein